MRTGLSYRIPNNRTAALQDTPTSNTTSQRFRCSGKVETLEMFAPCAFDAILNIRLYHTLFIVHSFFFGLGWVRGSFGVIGVRDTTYISEYYLVLFTKIGFGNKSFKGHMEIALGKEHLSGCRDGWFWERKIRTTSAFAFSRLRL